MLLFEQQQSITPRVAVCDADNSNIDASPGAPPSALACFYLPVGDTLDFGIDFSKWQAANGKPVLTSATWAVASDSPKTPVLSNSSSSEDGIALTIVGKGVGDVPGDAYYLECTATFGAINAGLGSPAIAARTIKRRINIVLVRG